MAKSRKIIKRRKSVGNIRKITKTMEMIATARFKRTYDRAMSSRVYHDELCGLFRRLRGDELLNHPLLREQPDHDRALLFVITSNQGYCGGYNGSILRLAVKTHAQLKDQGKETVIHVSGKKGIQYYKFLGKTIDEGYTQFDDKTRFAEVASLADRLMELYTSSAVGSIQVVAMRYELGSRYRPKVQNLLPVMDEINDESDEGVGLDCYLAEPGVEEIVDELAPMVVRTKLYRCFLDAAVSEQMTRMAAMKAATDNADKLIKKLKQQYNRARQTQITNELLDIMGGVEALK